MRHADELASIARKWFARMSECGTDVRELMHDGYPVACVEDAPFGYVYVFKAHVKVGFFDGAALKRSCKPCWKEMADACAT